MSDPRPDPNATDLAEAPSAKRRGRRGAGSQAVSSVEQPARTALHFLVGTPKEVLSRIVPGDPLGIRARVAARIRKRALLVDTDRVLIRSFACVARAAGEVRSDLGPWLDACIDEALGDILEAELEELFPAERAAAPEGARPGNAARRGRPGARVVFEPGPSSSSMSPPVSTSHASRGGGLFRSLAEPLGLDPVGLASACGRFNALATHDREAFFQLVLEARSLSEAAHEHGITGPELARRARRALDVFLPGD